MSAMSKLAGFAAGVSAVAVIGVAVAQGVEPNADIPNHPIAAGQQSSHETAMGETGVPAWEKQLPQTAVIVLEQPVAVIETPAPVAATEPAPQTTTMGAAPAETAPEVVAEAPVARADRN